MNRGSSKTRIKQEPHTPTGFPSATNEVIEIVSENKDSLVRQHSKQDSNNREPLEPLRSTSRRADSNHKRPLKDLIVLECSTADYSSYTLATHSVYHYETLGHSF